LGTPTHGSSCHANNNGIPPDSPNLKKKHGKNKGWVSMSTQNESIHIWQHNNILLLQFQLRSSFTKAFSRSNKNKPRNGSSFDGEGFMEIDGIDRRPSDLNGVDSSGHHHHHSHHHPHLQQQNGHKLHCSKLHLNMHQLHPETPGSPLLSPPQSNGCSSSSGSHSPRSNSGTNASSG
jgi:hypothetical protein